jgi:NADPH-dependent 2,4-dienoyl-CoA reductase/sulfur reductase-like enzyme
MKVLIIGGVAGGAAAAARLRRLDEAAEIIMFERGEYISFANCGLPYYIGGEIKDKEALTLQTPASFKAKVNVDVRVRNEVTAIDRTEKKVTVKSLIDGKEYEESYDKLIISTGADPVRPPVPGIDLPGIFTLRTIPDTLKIKDYAEREGVKALLSWRGYIGIETAENLHEKGLSVTIVEMADHVIAPLDFDMAAEVHAHIRSKGVNLILNNGVKAIEQSEGSLTVKLSEGEVKAEMVIMSVGVRPETALAKATGLEVNPRGSIVVKENMLTSDPDVYAVGDAVEITDFITGKKGFIPLAGPAAKQGRVAADNITGIKSVYTGTQGTAVLKCFDMTVGCTGINETVAKTNKIDYESVVLYSASHATYYPGSFTLCFKLLFGKKDGKVLGAQVTGIEGVDKRIDVVATAIRAE